MAFITKEEFYFEVIKRQYPDTEVFNSEERRYITLQLKKIFSLIMSEKFEFNCVNVKFLEDINNDFFCIMANYCNRYNKSLLKMHFRSFVLDLYNNNFFSCCHIYLKNLCQIFFKGSFSLESFIEE